MNTALRTLALACAATSSAGALVAVGGPASAGVLPAAQTASTSPAPSGRPSECRTPATVELTRSTITATGSGEVTVRATPGSTVRLFAYSQPSTSFRQVRSTALGSSGSMTWPLRPPTNTKRYAQQVGCDPSASVVLNVRTQLSLDVARTGRRAYVFSGRALPARGRGLIVSLYRVTGDGGQVLTSQTRADASNGGYAVARRFTGSGRFGFVVRTGQDLQNAPGSSNVRSLLVF